MEEKIKETIYQKGDKTHQDSFWYEGDIALLQYKDREVLVMAEGDIRIHNRFGELVFDNKQRGEGLDFELKEDKDLKKIGINYDDKYYWENNNWFGFLYKKTGSDQWHDCMGDVAHEYNMALEQARTALKQDKFWETF